MQIKSLVPNLGQVTTDTRQKLVETAGASRATPPAARKTALKQELSTSEQAQVSSLKARDAQVKQHERAHLAASAGINVSGASYTYARGPDGRNYAVGGEVRIDTSPGRSAEATLAKAEHIIDAALAPVDPSSVDRTVASRAQQMAQQAKAEIVQQQAEGKREQQAESQKGIKQTYAENIPQQSKINTFA